MVSRLRELVKSTPPKDNSFLSIEHLDILRKEKASHTNLMNQVAIRFNYAQELLRAAQPEMAFQEFND